ncbi:MAG: hypothetical protein KAW41_05615 [Candidatus Diapherotrites archaeon]|nr:hypothetical protein [Candidatus Diapherotrites archaeon]
MMRELARQHYIETMRRLPKYEGVGESFHDREAERYADFYTLGPRQGATLANLREHGSEEHPEGLNEKRVTEWLASKFVDEQAMALRLVPGLAPDPEFKKMADVMAHCREIIRNKFGEGTKEFKSFRLKHLRNTLVDYTNMYLYGPRGKVDRGWLKSRIERFDYLWAVPGWDPHPEFAGVGEPIRRLRERQEQAGATLDEPLAPRASSLLRAVKPGETTPTPTPELGVSPEQSPTPTGGTPKPGTPAPTQEPGVSPESATPPIAEAGEPEKPIPVLKQEEEEDVLSLLKKETQNDLLIHARTLAMLKPGKKVTMGDVDLLSSKIMDRGIGYEDAKKIARKIMEQARQG